MSRTAPGEPPRSVAEVGTFITMLAAACDDPEVNQRLEQILSMPDENRQGLVHAWVTDLLVAEAPRDFVQAIACLMDDRIAEKAYEVIFRCRRGQRL